MTDVQRPRGQVDGSTRWVSAGLLPAEQEACLGELQAAAMDSTYVSLGGRRTGSVHEFYRYPARFSPTLASAAIQTFTSPGGLVVDPFCGGGTSLVEAQRLGRASVGADINSLATFVTRAKTTLYSDEALTELDRLADLAETLKVAVGDALDNEWASQGYWRNISGSRTWRIRNLLVSAIAAVGTLDHDDARRLGRCVLLRTGQWALDMRESIPSVTEFRQQLSRDVASMAEVAREHREDVLSAFGAAHEPIVIDAGLPESAAHAELARGAPPSLILTSPPYPGVYVNYHRWKVQGRRETPAPYWVADRLDGHGIARYTMSARNRDDLRLYFEKLRTAYAAIVGLMGPATWLVQVVGFNDGDEQLQRYLTLMTQLGLEEVRFEALSTHTDGRLWRRVPGRRWWVSARELSDTAPSTAREVVLVHRRVS